MIPSFCFIFFGQWKTTRERENIAMTMEYTIEPCRGIAADVRLGVAACSVSESACNAGRCGPIKVIVRDFNGQFE